MKKFFILVLMAMIIPLSFIQLKASEPEDYTVYYEQKSLIDKMVVISGGATVDESNYASTGYLTLAMGTSTTFNIDLSNFQNMFSYFDIDNIASIVIDFELGSVYTGVAQENQQWLSSYSGWDVATQSITLNKNAMPSSVSVEAWWNVIGESGGAPSIRPGGLRFYSANLVVTYTEPVLLYEQITNFADLPDTNGAYTMVEFSPNNDGTFRALFHGIDGTIYLVSSMELPEEVGSPERAIYYTEDGANLLWFVLSDSFVIGGESLKGKDWLVWDLNTGVWTLTKNYTVHGKPYYQGGVSGVNGIYVDVIFPFEIDDLLAITFSYEYRYHYWIGDPGSWQKVENQTYLNGEYTKISSPWWNPFKKLFYGFDFQFPDIREFTDEVDAKYKSDYVAYMQEKGTGTYTVNSIFMQDFKAYSIFLGQYSKFGSNGVEARNIVIANFRVEIPGLSEPIIILPYDQQDFPDPGSPNSPNLTPDFDVLKTVISQAIQWLLDNPGIAALALLVMANWIYPIFMAAFNGIEKLGKIVVKLFTPRGALIGLLIFVAYYFFVR